MKHLDYLEQLHRLHRAGALTTEEFEQEKAKLLSTSQPVLPQIIATPQQKPTLSNKESYPIKALFLHLLLFIPILGWIATLVIWRIKNNKNLEIQQHSKIILFLFLSSLIYLLIGYSLTFYINFIFNYNLFTIYYSLVLIYYVTVLVYAGININNLNKKIDIATQYPMTLALFDETLKNNAAQSVIAYYTEQSIKSIDDLIIEKPSKNKQNFEIYAMFMHFSILIPYINWLIIAVMWLLKKDESSLIQKQGVIILNLLLSILAYVLIFIGIAPLLDIFWSIYNENSESRDFQEYIYYRGYENAIDIILNIAFYALLLSTFVYVIINAIRAKKGESTSYLIAIKFIKHKTLV